MSKVTDGLLSIASAAGAGKTDDALTQVAALRERHHKTAAALAPDAAKGDLGTQIDAQFDELAALVRALVVLREVSPRTLDVVASMGELLSSRIVAAAMNHNGLAAEWIDARKAVVTNDEYTRATPLSAETDAADRKSTRLNSSH